MIYLICLILPQNNYLTVGSPLGPVLDNVLTNSFETRWLWDCPNDFKLVFYRSGADDIFALFFFPDDADKCNKYLSSIYFSIDLSIQEGKDGCLLFLDVKIFRENGKFTNNVYKKRPSMGFIPTSRVLYLNHIKLASSFHPYFGASVFALIVSNFNIGLINGKVLYCIKVLYKSNYPLNLVIFLTDIVLSHGFYI